MTPPSDIQAMQSRMLEIATEMEAFVETLPVILNETQRHKLDNYEREAAQLADRIERLQERDDEDFPQGDSLLSQLERLKWEIDDEECWLSGSELSPISANLRSQLNDLWTRSCEITKQIYEIRYASSKR